MKNKPILFSGIIVAIIVFQTEFSDITKIWKPKVEVPNQHAQILMNRPARNNFEKRKPLNPHCVTDHNIAENKYVSL